MQKQDLNTSQSGSRHRSQANPISLPISPPPSSFPSNILSVPAQHFPNRPASTHGQRLPLSQSFVSRPNSNIDTQHRELKLDSMARLVHQQQQDPVKETNEINHGPANKDKNIQQFRHQDADKQNTTQDLNLANIQEKCPTCNKSPRYNVHELTCALALEYFFSNQKFGNDQYQTNDSEC